MFKKDIFETEINDIIVEVAITGHERSDDSVGFIGGYEWRLFKAYRGDEDGNPVNVTRDELKEVDNLWEITVDERLQDYKSK